MAQEWPLVGRERQLAIVLALVTDAAAGGALVVGPAGVGKTRLALECLAQVERAGHTTIRVTATQAATDLPFGAMARLLPLPGSAPDLPEHPGDYLRRCGNALLALAAGGRLVLMVDDAHLLDSASAVLVHQLAASAAVSVLATVRSDEPTPDPVRSLWKDNLVERIDLAPLTPEEVQALLEAVLGGPLDRGALASLVAKCQGNVLFLHEIVIGCLASGTLREDRGLWCLSGELAPSERLVEIVEARLGGLNDADRSLIERVALGESLGAGPAEIGDLAVVEALEQRGLLRSELSGRRLQIRLAHPVHGEVIRARLPAVRARRVARHLAEAVEAYGARRREDVLRTGTWRLQDGTGADPVLLLTAAYHARVAWDLPLAEGLARAAHAAGAGYDALLLVGQLASLTGRGEEAETIFADVDPSAVDDRRRSLLAEMRMDNLVWSLGRTDDAIEVAVAAEAAIGDPGLRDAVTAKRGAWLQVAGRPTEAVAVLEPLMDRAGGRTLVNVCQHLAIPLLSVGRTRAALEVGAQGLKAHGSLEGSPMFWGPYAHVALDCLALEYGGCLFEAEQRGAAGYDRAVSEGSQEAQALFAGVLASALLTRGRIRSAARVAREAVTIYRQMHLRAMVRMTLIPLILALAQAGRAAEAAQALAELDGLGLPPSDWPGPNLFRARAWVAVAGGDVATARRHLADGVALARDVGERVLEGVLLHDVARLGQPAGTAGALRDVALSVDSRLTPVQAAHADALVAKDGPALKAVAAEFKSLGADLLAAEAAADAALVFRRGGQDRSTTAAGRQAKALAAACEGARTPALATDMRARLTPAEREVAQLAAAGRSNREIAEHLHLSLRTVENYLHRAFKKLGVSGRAGLIAALD